ncbi:hypothetical protein KGF56_004911 [Candida oxycetoniae]|uniref:Outer spore wall protein RRT8 n=1 Tax=Candida oxycetoniae TaxID=497107 RepID=A0AAI9ST15_9ASCO|nr:uncharacterized protein KGF56_004911 [Candida oxycetoniae]KAI3402341.2 hypothetical protein KGF56_004911 [Candida oxycetoniae]
MIAAWYSLYSQSSTIAKFIITFTLLPYIQKIAYDAVLSRESHDVYLEFAKERRRRNTTYNIPVIRRIARYLHEMPDLSIFPFSLPKLFLLFMLNLIPVFGPIFVMFFQASSKGLQAHRRYFMLKGYSRSEIRERYKIDKPIYMAFGLTALLLEMVPILSVFFMFTNTIGAALWVVDLEKQEKLVSFEREEKTQLKMKPLIPNEPSIFNGEEPLLHTGTQLQTHGNLHYNES